MKETATEYVDLEHFMPTRFERSGGFWLIRAGRNIAKPNYWIGRKQIDCFGLHMVRSGKLILRYENAQITLEAGDLFCLFPHLTYEYHIEGEAELRMLWLSLQGPQLPDLMALIGVTPELPYRQGALREDAAHGLQEVERIIWAKPDAGRKLALLAAVYRFFASLEVSSGSRQGSAGPHAAESWIEEAQRFLQLHFSEELRIEAVARQFGLHRSYFSHAFAQKLGQSPQQYVQQLRLQRAQQLLADPHLAIGEIALSVGYPDLYMFSRAFKKQVGCSPSDYRERKKPPLS